MKNRGRWALGIGAVLAAALAAVLTFTNTKPPPEPPGPVGLQVVLLGGQSDYGMAAQLTGVSVRDPLHRDASGKTADEALASHFFGSHVATYRHTAGSHSYKIRQVNDPAMQKALALLELFPVETRHDFTWPPQLPDDGVSAWVTYRTGRISLPNEPPVHIGPTKEFATPQAYVSKCEAIYDNPANAAFRDKFWIQSGKPEVVEGGSASEKTRHLAVQTAMQQAVLSGRLPNRIITTHKLLPEYNAVDWYAWYRDLIGDYQDIYGQGTKICFQEWNWPEAVLSQDGVVASGHFLLVMAALKDKLGPVIDGACYHQYSSVSKEVVDEDKSVAPPMFSLSEGVWRPTALHAVWQQFAAALGAAAYVRTSFPERPDSLALEVFQYPDGTKVLLWSNRGDAVQVAIAGDLLMMAENLTITQDGKFTGNIPEKSVGAVRL